MRYGLTIVALTISLVLMFSGSEFVRAHEGAEGIIKERMETMKIVGAAMKNISKIVRSKSPLDTEKIAKAAGTINKHAKRMDIMFPKGSDNDISRANSEIWRDWDNFLNQARNLETAASTLENSAQLGDELEIKAAYRGLRKTCGGCHKQFRTKKKKVRRGY